MCETVVSESFLREILPADFPTLLVYPEIDSTNNESKRLAAGRIASDESGEGKTPSLPAVIVADRQSAGRGRMTRRFYSPAGTGAYFSILWKPDAPIGTTLSLTCAAAVAVTRAIRTLTGKQTKIKWVNDLYLDGKKVCGILCESVTCGSDCYAVIGIGVNLSTRDFPPDAAIAGSLGVAPTDFLRERLIAEVCRELSPMLRDPTTPSWLDEYRRHSAVLGKTVEWNRNGPTETEPERGVAVAIGSDGALIVRREDGSEIRLSTGEISCKIIE